MIKFRIALSKYEDNSPKKSLPNPQFRAAKRKARMEFHINKETRDGYGLEGSLFSLTGNVVLADMRQVRTLAQQLNGGVDPAKNPERVVRAGQLNAMGLIDEVLHYMVALYREQVQPNY